MIKARMEGVIVNGESLFFQGKHVIAKLALERRLPSCVYVRELVEAGGLIAYQHLSTKPAARLAIARWSTPEGREAGGNASGATNHIRTPDQS
jgi:hypothetical protein